MAQEYFEKLRASSRVLPSRRTLFTLLMVICIVVGGAITVVHRLPAYAAGPTLKTSSTSGHYVAGLSTTLQGTGYQTHEVVSLYWNYTGSGTGVSLGTAKANPAGSFNQPITIPLYTTGTYTIAATGQTSGLTATTTFLLLPGITVSVVATGIGTPLSFQAQAFGVGETVNVYWNRVNLSKGILVAQGIADSTGSFQGSFLVPSAPTSHIPIVGVGQTSHTSGTAIFVPFSATLAMGPLVGSSGSQITVSGYGFQSNENVNIYWNSSTTPILTSAVNQYGYIAMQSITAPTGLAAGTYPVKAVGQTSNITAVTNFTVVAASSSLSLTSGPVNTSIRVLGQGYTPGETVNVIWNYQGTPITVASVTAALSGAVTTNFIVPTATPGSYNVAVSGSTSQLISQNTFTVANGLVSFPSTISPSTNTTISGTGFQANETVQLFLNIASSPLLLATATTDSNGNFSQVITIPSSTSPGVYTITGTGQASGHSFATPITIDTSWNDFGFDNNHTRNNIYENTLSPSNVANLALKWQAFETKGIKNSVVYGNGVLYTTTYDGKLRAYSTASHNLLWEFDSNTLFDSPAAPLFDPGTNTVFFGVEANAIAAGYIDIGVPTPFYGVDATTGKIKWSIIIPLNDFGFPTLYKSTVYFGGSNEGQPAGLYAVDALTGNINWTYHTNAGVWGASAVDPVQNIVFTNVGNPVFQEVALNATTGAVIWQTFVPFSAHDTDPGSGIVVKNGLVYTSSKNDYAFAFQESNGAVAWSTKISSVLGDVSSPALSSANIDYIGSYDGNVYALDATTGNILWKTFVDAQGIASSPAIANGVVYIATLGGLILALDATSGLVLWSFPTKGNAFSSPIVVNGWLYCSSNDGYLYAFSL